MVLIIVENGLPHPHKTKRGLLGENNSYSAWHSRDLNYQKILLQPCKVDI